MARSQSELAARIARFRNAGADDGPNDDGVAAADGTSGAFWWQKKPKDAGKPAAETPAADAGAADSRPNSEIRPAPAAESPKTRSPKTRSPRASIGGGGRTSSPLARRREANDAAEKYASMSMEKALAELERMATSNPTLKRALQHVHREPDGTITVGSLRKAEAALRESYDTSARGRRPQTAGTKKHERETLPPPPPPPWQRESIDSLPPSLTSPTKPTRMNVKESSTSTDDAPKSSEEEPVRTSLAQELKTVLGDQSPLRLSLEFPKRSPGASPMKPSARAPPAKQPRQPTARTRSPGKPAMTAAAEAAWADDRGDGRGAADGAAAAPPWRDPKTIAKYVSDNMPATRRSFAGLAGAKAVADGDAVILWLRKFIPAESAPVEEIAAVGAGILTRSRTRGLRDVSFPEFLALLDLEEEAVEEAAMMAAGGQFPIALEEVDDRGEFASTSPQRQGERERALAKAAADHYPYDVARAPPPPPPPPLATASLHGDAWGPDSDSPHVHFTRAHETSPPHSPSRFDEPTKGILRNSRDGAFGVSGEGHSRRAVAAAVAERAAKEIHAAKMPKAVNTPPPVAVPPPPKPLPTGAGGKSEEDREIAAAAKAAAEKAIANVLEKAGAPGLDDIAAVRAASERADAIAAAENALAGHAAALQHVHDVRRSVDGMFPRPPSPPSPPGRSSEDDRGTALSTYAPFENKSASKLEKWTVEVARTRRELEQKLLVKDSEKAAKRALAAEWDAFMTTGEPPKDAFLVNLAKDYVVRAKEIERLRKDVVDVSSKLDAASKSDDAKRKMLQELHDKAVQVAKANAEAKEAERVAEAIAASLPPMAKVHKRGSTRSGAPYHYHPQQPWSGYPGYDAPPASSSSAVAGERAPVKLSELGAIIGKDLDESVRRVRWAVEHGGEPAAEPSARPTPPHPNPHPNPPHPNDRWVPPPSQPPLMFPSHDGYALEAQRVAPAVARSVQLPRAVEVPPFTFRATSGGGFGGSQPMPPPSAPNPSDAMMTERQRRQLAEQMETMERLRTQQEHYLRMQRALQEREDEAMARRSEEEARAAAARLLAVPTHWQSPTAKAAPPAAAAPAPAAVPPPPRVVPLAPRAPPTPPPIARAPWGALPPMPPPPPPPPTWHAVEPSSRLAPAQATRGGFYGAPEVDQTLPNLEFGRPGAPTGVTLTGLTPREYVSDAVEKAYADTLAQQRAVFGGGEEEKDDRY